MLALASFRLPHGDRPPISTWPQPRPFPSTVPRQSLAQLAAMQHISANARRASAEATPELIALLDSEEIQTTLMKCCPSLNRSALSLLTELRESVQSAELVHSFDGVEQDSGAVTIEMNLYNATEYFPHLWQLRYLRWAGPLVRYGQPNAESISEESIFGMDAFPGRNDVPTSFAEASSRLLYVSANMMGIDSGNRPFGYGNVTAVLSPAYWDDAVGAAAADTGFYTVCCNADFQRRVGFTPQTVLSFCGSMQGAVGRWTPQLYCNDTTSRYLTIPGTRGHMDHAILANDRTKRASAGRSTIARFFERRYGASDGYTNVTGREAFDYLEANVLASVRYAERGIKLLVGSFPALYGTHRGRLLAEWAVRQRIALTWALGCGEVYAAPPFETAQQSCYNTSFAGDERLLDGHVALVLQQRATPGGTRLNSTVSAADAAYYEHLWARVEAARDAAGGLPRPTVLSFWAEATAHARGNGSRARSMMVGLPRPHACDWHVCVGATRPGGECVCYGR